MTEETKPARGHEDDTTFMLELKEILDQLPGPRKARSIEEEHLRTIGQAINERGEPFGKNDLVLFKSEEGKIFSMPVARLPAKVGRDPQKADLVLEGKGISRVHFSLAQRGALVYARDERSTNGLYLNKKKINEESLVSGDKLLLGTVEFEVVRG